MTAWNWGNDDGQCEDIIVNDEASAKLIAAAPDLLDMVKRLVDTEGAPMFARAEAIKEARALIAKVEG